MTAITEPGIYDGLDEAAYHADPVPDGSLSSTGARKMLPPSCPALFRYEQDHPVFKAEFDYGSAAHKLVLGTGPKIEIIDAKDWRTNAAKEARDAARANGFVPLLLHEFGRVEAMAAKIQEHELAGALFDRYGGGKAEQSGFWYDEEFGTWCRLRADWLPGRTFGGRFVIVDYKTAHSAEPDAFAKAVANWGYHQQDAWYSDGIVALGLDDDPEFLFVVQEVNPPHLVTVARINDEDRQVGRERNRNALERFRDCRASGIWPSYTDDIAEISLPPWARSRGDDDR